MSNDGEVRRVLGAVLAGGASRRFGSDKAAALLDGQPLIAHAVRALQAVADAVVVCGREYDGVPALADRPQTGLGPLGGLCAALHHAQAGAFSGVLTTGCDMPLLPDAAARLLIGPSPAVLRGQQIVGYWPAALSPILDAWLGGGGDRAIIAFARAVGARFEAFGDVLPNVNSGADLERLRGDRRTA